MANEIKFVHNLRGEGRPKILLIGNGIERVYNGNSWNDLLNTVGDEYGCDKETRAAIDKLPFPLGFELLATPKDNPSTFSSDQLKAEAKCMKNTMDRLLPSDQTREKYKDENYNRLFKKLPSLGVDHIFTTNYSYCIEETYYPNKKLESDRSRGNIRFNINPQLDILGNPRKETVFRMHSGYIGDVGSNSAKKIGIWHIHGECGAPSSVILGHDKYGRLLNRIITVLEEDISYAKLKKYDNQYEFKSWPELFLFGDIYIVGFGFADCEFDLWWLLRRKQRELNADGKVYFYEYDNTKNPEHTRLLSAYGVDIIDNNLLGNADSFEEFYKLAFEDIRGKCSKGV